MARGNLTFKQTDVTRAIRAAVAAGVEVARVEVDKEGRIVIIAGKADSGAERNVRNGWDEKYGDH
jgi:hypothetical protein